MRARESQMLYVTVGQGVLEFGEHHDPRKDCSRKVSLWSLLKVWLPQPVTLAFTSPDEVWHVV